MTTERKFTGKHALLVFGGCFAVIISVNLALAFAAVRSFPGLEVKNSYVASQSFDARRTAQAALGWQIAAQAEDGVLTLHVTDAQGRAVRPATLEATFGRATHVRDDQVPAFEWTGQSFEAPVTIAPGNWNLRLRALADDGTEFTQRVVLRVKG